MKKNMLSDLPLARKFALIGVIAAAVAAVPTALAIRDAAVAVGEARAEAAAIAPATAVLKLMQSSQQHRGTSAMVLAGDEKARATREARQADVEQTLGRLRGDLVDPALAKRLAAIETAWKDLAGAVAGKSIDGRTSFARHTALIADQAALLTALTHASALAFDHDEVNNGLVATVFEHLPALTETLGQMRARGAAVLTRGEAAAEDRMRINGLTELSRLHAGRLNQSLAGVTGDAPGLTALAAGATAAAKAADGVLALADEQIVRAPTLTLASAEWWAATTKTIDAQYALVPLATAALDARLAARVGAEQRFLATIGVAIAVLAGVGLWIMVIVARTTRAMREAAAVAERVAAGDLTSTIGATGRDEAGQVLAALRRMNDGLLSIVTDVRQTSDGVATGSAQIAVGNADLSQRTEQQASNLQQTAASMEQLTATVQQNSATAGEARQLAADASAAAAHGGSVVAEVVGTMERIAQSSHRIADIIGTIDGIAFQTNILALNAAVEAARAGEQGRGFAVVASEVRALAGRSAEAAREIKSLIGASVETVDAGTRLAGDAGRSMDGIVEQVRRVAGLIGAISAASAEQSQGIAQVGAAVVELDRSTQQNAALVEESAAAAESLKQQAARLAAAVGVFKLAA